MLVLSHVKADMTERGTSPEGEFRSPALGGSPTSAVHDIPHGSFRLQLYFCNYSKMVPSKFHCSTLLGNFFQDEDMIRAIKPSDKAPPSRTAGCCLAPCLVGGPPASAPQSHLHHNISFLTLTTLTLGVFMSRNSLRMSHKLHPCHSENNEEDKHHDSAGTQAQPGRRWGMFYPLSYSSASRGAARKRPGVEKFTEIRKKRKQAR